MLAKVNKMCKKRHSYLRMRHHIVQFTKRSVHCCQGKARFVASAGQAVQQQALSGA